MNARILVTTLALVVGMASGLTGCGQRGPLYLPTEPAAQDRATLPQILTPTLPSRKTDTPP
jgi:predicted small lipoprotein YifL